MKNSTNIRTRFAPSPTGYMHIGNLRTALYTYLLAKKHGGTFILRIEDTDQERFVAGATEVIYDTLKAAGLFYDEGPDVGGSFGPYIQSERREIYKKHADLLIERGNAYYCFCNQEILNEQRNINKAGNIAHKYDRRCLFLSEKEIAENLKNKPYVIRQKIPAEGKTFFDDHTFGRIEVDNAKLDDPVLMKSDGLPTYNFANVVDDHLMGITHILRGKEFLDSTPKYILLYEGFGWEVPEFIHVPPITNDDSQKLSKRHGDANFNDFIEKGYLVEALINFIALLGWSPGGKEVKFTLDELISKFDIKGLSKNPSIFNYKNLNSLNGSYIRAMSDGAFYTAALPFIKKTVKRDIDTVFAAKILQERCDVLSEIIELLDFIDEMPDYGPALFFNKKTRLNIGQIKEYLPKIIPVLEKIENWTHENISNETDKLIKQLNIEAGTLLSPLRTALSGKEFTPGGGKGICYLLGKDESIKRIKKAMEILDKYEENTPTVAPVLAETAVKTNESVSVVTETEITEESRETETPKVKRHLTETEEINRIAALAKLDVSDAAEVFSKSIKPIIDVLDKLIPMELPIDNYPLDMSLTNVLREDIGVLKTREETLAERERLLSAAPEIEAACISVPKILGKGE